MSKVIGLNINLSKIEKERIVQGKKGKYLDAVVMLNDEKDQYGNDGMIVQSVSKEERENGVRGEILGNVKILSGGNGKPPVNEPVDVSDDLPF